MKTSELTGAALDWSVAKCEGISTKEFLALHSLSETDAVWKYRYSSDWAQGGPIIDREICEIIKGGKPTYWEARAGFDGEPGHAVATGPTPLIAAMRCYVASKLGDEIEIPEELTC